MQNKEKKQSSLRAKSVEYSQFGMLRFCAYLLYICVIVLSVLCIWFLYTRTYITIGQVTDIATMSQFTKTQVLNISSYDKVIDALEKKNSQSITELVRDPFNKIQSIDNVLPEVEIIATSTVTISNEFTQDL